MRLAEKAARIGAILDRLHPEPPIPLRHADPYTLLVSVVLSAQCTDARVNQVTPGLFALASTPAAMARLPTARILAAIRSCGLAPRKARAIRELSRLLVERHGGGVPASYAELEALPGVGHKTAGVVRAQAFGLPAFPVDTHVHRLAARWGLSSGRSVAQTERDLMRVFPEAEWARRHLQMIHFGRAHCPARGHDPAECPICSWADTHRGRAGRGTARSEPASSATARARRARPRGGQLRAATRR